MKDRDGEVGPAGQAWLCRQNIARYKAMLANPAKRVDHEQIAKLLEEEEARLRALDER